MLARIKEAASVTGRTGQRCSNCHQKNHMVRSCVEEKCEPSFLCGNLSKHPDEKLAFQEKKHAIATLQMPVKKVSQELTARQAGFSHVPNSVNKNFSCVNLSPAHCPNCLHEQSFPLGGFLRTCLDRVESGNSPQSPKLLNSDFISFREVDPLLWTIVSNNMESPNDSLPGRCCPSRDIVWCTCVQLNGLYDTFLKSLDRGMPGLKFLLYLFIGIHINKFENFQTLAQKFA